MFTLLVCLALYRYYMKKLWVIVKIQISKVKIFTPIEQIFLFSKSKCKFFKKIFSPIYYTYICTYTILTSYTMLTLHLLALLTIHILQYNYTNQIELQLINFCYCLHVNCSSHKEEFCLLITLHSKSKIGHCIYEVLLDLTHWIFNLKHTNI